MAKFDIKDSVDGYKSFAKLLPKRYEDYTIDELANGLNTAIIEKNSRDTNIYLSALVLRNIYQVNNVYDKVKSTNMDREEILSRISTIIYEACQEAAWKINPTINAQQCIAQKIATRGSAAIMYESNLVKNKANYNMMSFDEPTGDNESTIGELFIDQSQFTDGEDKAKAAIQHLLNNNKIMEAIIADCIVYKDVFKTKKETTTEIDAITNETREISKISTKLWDYKLIRELSELTDEDLNLFISKYIINSDKVKAAFSAFSEAKNTKKYKQIRSTLEALRTDTETLSLLQG